MAVLNDDDLEREEMLRQLEQPQARRRTTPYEQGGVTGNTTPRSEGIAPDPDTPAAPPAAAPAQSYNMRGFEADKLAAPADQQSEKYKIGNIFKKYDPKAGVTPELLAELNALGIAEFSGSAGNLTVNNTKNDPRFGSGGTGDVVFAYDAQNGDTAWQPWFIDDGGGAAGAGGLGGAMSRIPGMDTDPSSVSRINGLMPTDTDFFNRLQAEAQRILGGSGAFDREALLKMLGA